MILISWRQYTSSDQNWVQLCKFNFGLQAKFLTSSSFIHQQEVIFTTLTTFNLKISFASKKHKTTITTITTTITIVPSYVCMAFRCWIIIFYASKSHFRSKGKKKICWNFGKINIDSFFGKFSELWTFLFTTFFFTCFFFFFLFCEKWGEIMFH